MGAAALPAEGEETTQDAGNVLNQVGGFLNKHKGSILSTLGLGEAEDGELEKSAFTGILNKLNLDTGMITNMTSSVTSLEGMASVVNAFKDPSSIGDVIKKQTGWDQEYVDSVTSQIKNALGSSAVRVGSDTCLALLVALLVSKIVL